MVTWLVLVLFACNGDPKTTNPVFFDEDGDGFTSDEDCNDNDPSIYPTADEVCDEKDNDLNGEIDVPQSNRLFGTTGIAVVGNYAQSTSRINNNSSFSKKYITSP